MAKKKKMKKKTKNKKKKEEGEKEEQDEKEDEDKQQEDKEEQEDDEEEEEKEDEEMNSHPPCALSSAERSWQRCCRTHSTGNPVLGTWSLSVPLEHLQTSNTPWWWRWAVVKIVKLLI